MKINSIPIKYNSAIQSSYVAATGFANILNEEIKELDRTKDEKDTKRTVIRKDNSSSIDFNM